LLPFHCSAEAELSFHIVAIFLILCNSFLHFLIRDSRGLSFATGKQQNAQTDRSFFDGSAKEIKAHYGREIICP